MSQLDDALPKGQEIWRVGRKPDPWKWVDWQWATDGRFSGRWDDAQGQFRTLHAATTLLGCLLEVLAHLRPNRGVGGEVEAVSAVGNDEDQFPTRRAGEIDPTWLEVRCAASGTLWGRFCAVTTSTSLASLRTPFLAQALDLGLDDLDAAALKAPTTRPLTQAIATHIHQMQDFDGVRFASRHGDDLEMWAIFERPTEGRDVPSPPQVTEQTVVRLDRNDPALVKALRMFHLRWGPDTK